MADWAAVKDRQGKVEFPAVRGVVQVGLVAADLAGAGAAAVVVLEVAAVADSAAVVVGSVVQAVGDAAVLMAVVVRGIARALLLSSATALVETIRAFAEPYSSRSATRASTPVLIR